MKFFFSFSFYLVSIITVLAQPTTVSVKNGNFPSVFEIGEQEKQYEALVQSYETSLLTACNDNMQSAFDKWLSMLMEMEGFAEAKKFDLKGTKLWLHVFWNKNGSIAHIGFHLRPQSKNIPTNVIKEFLEEFILQYKFPLMANTPYYHYSSASFPVKFVKNEE